MTKVARNFSCLAAIVVLPALLTSCASVMHGSSQQVGFSSSPTGASVMVDNAVIGTTPVSAELRRKEEHLVSISMDGYETFEFTITKSTSGWVWGNLLLGGIVGLIVDYSTGAAYNLNPEQVESQLVRGGGGAEYKDGRLYVFLAEHVAPTPAMVKIGQMTPVRP